MTTYNIFLEAEEDAKMQDKMQEDNNAHARQDAQKGEEQHRDAGTGELIPHPGPD